MSMLKPDSRTWVLRCKIHKTTVLLFAEASTTLTALKVDLHTALQETNPTGFVETETGAIRLPQSAEEIILGKLVDPNDTRGGWTSLEGERDDYTASVIGKGKGKAPAGNNNLSNGVSKHTVQSAGLKDGALVGVKFRDTDGLIATSIETGVGHTEIWDIVLPRLELELDEDEDEAVQDLEAIPQLDNPLPLLEPKKGSGYNR